MNATNAPLSPPPHRLPVLTEVVLLEDETAASVESEVASADPLEVDLSLLGVEPAEPVSATAAEPLSSVAPVRALFTPPAVPPANMPVLHDVAVPQAWSHSGRAALEMAVAELDDDISEGVPSAAEVDHMVAAVAAAVAEAGLEPVSAAAAAMVGAQIASKAPQQLDAPPSTDTTGSDAGNALPGDDLPQPPSWLRRKAAAEAEASLPLPAAAPPMPLPADFSGSWWSRGEAPTVAAARAAITSPQGAEARTGSPSPTSAPAANAPTTVQVSEREITRRVMRELDAQLDHMFDHRMREVIAPALARAADALMADVRERLVVTVREMVTRAVTVELARLQREQEDD